MDQDDLFAKQWESFSPAPVSQPISQESNAECSEYWLVPLYTDKKLLQDQLDDISRESGTHLVYISEEERVNIWGNHASVLRAKHALSHIANYCREKVEKIQKEKKVKGWAKPDRELTPAEKKKKEREEKRRLERERYLGQPTAACAYNHFINWPKELPISRLFGINLNVLDPLRNEFQCFIWMEQSMLIIAGDDEYKTYTAMNRIKNYILKRLKQFSGTVLHVLEKPSKLVKIYINETPHAPYIDLPQQMIDDPKDIKRGRKFFIAEELATYESLRDLDLQMAKVDIGASAEQESKAENTGGAKDNYFQSMKYSDSMMELNTEKIRMSLENALGHVQLLECDIKMRIRFGQVALIDYPERPTWDIKELDSNVIPDTRLTSEFSPFFTDSSDKFSVLIRKLSNPEFQETPEMLWTLGILKRTQFHDYIEAQLEVSFRDDDDKVALWNALVEKTTPLDIRVISSERLFSWAWSISASKRLESDKFSPEGKFVHDMHLDRKGRDARLVYATSQDVQLKHVKREKKWSFARDPWTIELTEEAFWKFQKPSKPYQKLTLGNPDKTLYSVSIYRDSWNMRFYDNPHLGLGQLAGWKPSDFLEGEESIGKTLESISDLRDIIERLF